MLLATAAVAKAPAVASASSDRHVIAFPQIGPIERLNDGVKPHAWHYQPHPSEEYLQTWLLHTTTQDGWEIFANLAIANIGIGDNSCGLNLAIVSPAGESHTETIHLPGSTFSGSTTSMSFNCGDIRVRGDANSFHVYGTTATLGLNITVNRHGPGFAPGAMWLDDERNQYVRYNAPFISGPNGGTFRVGSNWRAALGRSTLEHVVANVGMHRYSKVWHRLRINDSGTSLLLGTFEPTKKFTTGMAYAILFDRGKVVHVSTDVRITPASFRHHHDSGYMVPTALHVAINDGRLRLDATAEYRRDAGDFSVLSHLHWLIRLIAKTFFANPWVFRHQVRVTGDYVLQSPAKVLEIDAIGVYEVTFVND